MSKNCKLCPARFDGEGQSEALGQHVESFHPEGAPTPVALREPATGITLGHDLAPAVNEIASGLGDVKVGLGDLAERVKALEDGTRSSVDLEVLAEQLAPYLERRFAAPAAPAEAPASTPPADEGASYADLQARAKELGIPAIGTRDALADAIAAEEAKTGSAS